MNRRIKNLPAKFACVALGLAALTASAQTAATLGSLPLCFEAGPGSQFLARGQDSQFLVSPAGAQLALRKTAPDAVCAVRMQFVGASPQAKISGDGELPGKINYLTGSSPAQWRAGVPTFSKVRVAGIYSGIDLVYYGNQRQLEYDFNLAAGVNPEAIAIRFAGADKIAVNARGELVLKLGSGEIRQPRPLIYQAVGGVRHEIAGGYKILDAHTVAFAVGKYDAAQPLVIDPVLSYATYFGGTLGETAAAVAVNANDGSIYIAGQTFSQQFYYTPGAFQTNFAGGQQAGDAFVAKFDNLGKNLIYLTYLGGSGNDSASSLALDASGNVYVTGFTDSTNFPCVAALYTNISGVFDAKVKNFPVDAFVTELDAGGSNLVYSTYLGGSSVDASLGIAVDAAGAAYLTGYTYSSNFPTVNALQDRLACTNSVYKNANAFVAKVAPGGSSLVFSTYLGGTNFDQGRSIAVDAAGSAYVTGFTGSTNFPATNYVNQTIGTKFFDGHLLNAATNKNSAYDVFVTKFTPAGTSLVYSTLLGSTNNDLASHIAVDGAGNAYVTGYSSSTNFPNTITNLAGRPLFLSTNRQTLFIVTNVFLTKIQFLGTNATIDYSVLFGGSRANAGYGVAVDPAGNAFVVGATTSTNFPCFPTNSAGFLRATNSGGSDVFVTAFNTNATALLYSTLLGGKKNDSGYAIALDPLDSAYIAGVTDSTNFPALNAGQSSRSGTNDTFLAKIWFTNPPPPVLDIAWDGTNVLLSYSAFLPEFKVEGTLDLTSNIWGEVEADTVLTNGLQVITFPTTNYDHVFFRLHKP